MDEVSTDIQTQARDLAKAANPNLSENTLDRLGTIAGQQGARLMDGLKLGECGRLTMAFKDKAQDSYGLLSMQLKNGQVVMSEAYDPGSQIAEGAIADLKKGEAAPGIERNSPIVSVTARSCKL